MKKCFVVVTHKSIIGTSQNGGQEWQTEENVEFVTEVRKRHTDCASIIADAVNQKVIKGSRFGYDSYQKVDDYLRKSYNKQMQELDVLLGRASPTTQGDDVAEVVDQPTE